MPKSLKKYNLIILQERERTGQQHQILKKPQASQLTTAFIDAI